MKKSTFTIDVDDPEDIKKHIKMLQRRFHNLMSKTFKCEKISFGVSNANVFDILPIFEHIIKLPYPNKQNVSVGNYYVYAHCDPTQKLDISRDIRELVLASQYNLSHLPFYIGKGIGNRCNDLNRNEGHRKKRSKILSVNKEVKIVKIFENISEDEALFEEQKLIALLGLSSLNKNGLLVNLQTDKSILEYFLHSVSSFKVPECRKEISENKEKQILRKYKNYIKVMSKWI